MSNVVEFKLRQDFVRYDAVADSGGRVLVKQITEKHTPQDVIFVREDVRVFENAEWQQLLAGVFD